MDTQTHKCPFLTHYKVLMYGVLMYGHTQTNVMYGHTHYIGFITRFIMYDHTIRFSCIDPLLGLSSIDTPKSHVRF